VSFNTNAVVEHSLASDTNALLLALSGVAPPAGNTHISSAIQTAQAELANTNYHRADSLPVMILLSDGKPTAGDTGSNAVFQAGLAKTNGTRIFTIGLGADVDPALMGAIASSTNDYFYTADSTNLTALFWAIAAKLCRTSAPPLVRVTAPTNGAVFTEGVQTTLQATATNADDSITSVRFFNGSQALGYASSAGSNLWTFAWSTVPLGSNILTAVATDNDGLASTSPEVTITVVHPPPTVAMMSPTNGELFVLSPTNIVVRANASASGGAVITNVQFFCEGTNLGQTASSPYQVLWTNVMAGSNYTLTALATDSLGAAATDSVPITVNAMPIITNNAPTNLQAFLELASVGLTNTAWDPDGAITNVTFYTWSNSVAVPLLGNVASNNLSYSYSWTNLTNDYYPVFAVATDNRGAQSASPITVFRVNPTNTAPVVWITSPTNGETFKAWPTTTIRANTLDNAAIGQVDFFEGTNYLGTDTSASISASATNFEITVRGLKPGKYSFRARAKRAANPFAEGVSTNVTITVSNDLIFCANGFWDPVFGHFRGLGYDHPGYGASVSIDQNRDLYLGGYGGSSGDLPKLVVRSGCSWSPPYGISESGSVNALLTHGEQLYLGCSQFEAPTNYGFHLIAIRDNLNIAELGDGLYFEVPGSVCGLPPETDDGTHALHMLHGDLHIGGNFVGTGTETAEGVNTNIQYVAKLPGNSTNWSGVGASKLNGRVMAIADLQDTLYVGGNFTAAGTNTAVCYLARLVNGDWQPVGAGVNGRVRALASHNGRLLVGGEFTTAGGFTNANCIACWDGKEWSTINNGVGDGTQDYLDDCVPTNRVAAIAARGNEIYVTGEFTRAWNGDQAIEADYVARATWSEAEQSWQWSALEEGLRFDDWGGFELASGRAITIHDLTNGSGYEVVVAGTFTDAGAYPLDTVARWVVGQSECSTNPPAVVAIVSPANLSSFRASDSFSITATASAGVDSVSAVEFFMDGYFIGYGDFANDTYTLPTSADSPGVHQFIARAVCLDSSWYTEYKVSSPPIYLRFTNLNDTIEAQNDSLTVTVNDAATNLYVLANDQTSTTNDLRITRAWQIQGNSASIRVSADAKSVIYLPNANAYGTDRFYYSATDGSAGASAQVGWQSLGSMGYLRAAQGPPARYQHSVRWKERI